METKKYKRVYFPLTDPQQREIILGLLSAKGWNFEELETGLIAYKPVEEWDEKELENLTMDFDFPLGWEISEVSEQNWNSLWEKQISPLYINDELYIRTSFHPPAKKDMLEIVIDPKMSFGTGHHPTTELMIRFLLEEQIKGKNLIDMGTGTGVLSIIACKKGAARVYAIDNDPWSYENARENVIKNQCENVQIILNDASALKTLPPVDIFMANINRNIILNDLERYVNNLKKGSILILSGFYADDEDIVLEKARLLGLKHLSSRESDTWLGMKFVR